MKYKVGDAFIDEDEDYLVIVDIIKRDYRVYYPRLNEHFIFSLRSESRYRQLSEIEKLLFLP